MATLVQGFGLLEQHNLKNILLNKKAVDFSTALKNYYNNLAEISARGERSPLTKVICPTIFSSFNFSAR